MHPLLSKYFEIVRKITPSKAETPAVGIDIGAGECKLVEIRRVGDKFELTNWALEIVPEGDVSVAIKKLLTRLDNPTQSPYTAVFGKGTLIRYIDMPKMSIDELKNSFAIEAEKYFPFAQDQIYTDCYIIDDQSKGKQMLVMAAAAKKELVDDRMKVLSSIGLKTDFIGVNPIALANVVHMVGHPDELNDKDHAIAVLDMGNSVSNLTVLVNRLPRFSRDIYIGGRDLTTRISNAMGISFEEAERLKNNPGDKLEQAHAACETAIINLVKEMRLSFDYFTTEKNFEIKKLLLTGGGSMLEGIKNIFEKNLDLPIVLWDPMKQLSISSKVKKDELDKISYKLGVALGLALYHYD